MDAKLFRINLGDLGRGCFLAVLTALIGGIYEILSTGALPDIAALKAIGLTALAAGLAYLGKNLLTNSKGDILKPESK